MTIKMNKSTKSYLQVLLIVTTSFALLLLLSDDPDMGLREFILQKAFALALGAISVTLFRKLK